VSIATQIMLALCGSGVLVGIAALVIRNLREGGADKGRADRAEQDLIVAKKQGEIIAEQRTTEDAASCLDSGAF
jgi:hypothetical protein